MTISPSLVTAPSCGSTRHRASSPGWRSNHLPVGTQQRMPRAEPLFWCGRRGHVHARVNTNGRAPRSDTLACAAGPPKPTAEPCPDKIVSARNVDLSYRNHPLGQNWRCADAYHAKFLGADMSGTELHQANLSTADVSLATFAGAHPTRQSGLARSERHSNQAWAELLECRHARREDVCVVNDPGRLPLRGPQQCGPESDELHLCRPAVGRPARRRSQRDQFYERKSDRRLSLWRQIERRHIQGRDRASTNCD